VKPEVRIVEVGPRDGLQNEKGVVPTSLKADFIRALWGSGVGEVESTSFVSPKAVPQMADAAELILDLGERAAETMVLVPNQRGLDRALECGAKRIALFTAASDAFAEKNIGMTVEQSLAVFRELVAQFRARVPNGYVRGYVSTVVECPFTGWVMPEKVAKVVEAFSAMHVDDISLGETLGVAVPDEVAAVARAVERVAAVESITWHFHDTRGTALANVFAVLERGYRSFDSSAGGLGGCPFAPGAGGNVATEDLVYALERAGFRTGIDLTLLARASLPVLQAVGSPVRSRAQQASLASVCG